MTKNCITASLINIGNEILSGRTEDKNINFLAKELNKIGINLKEVRIIPDDKEVIIKTINELRKKHNYVFTTGGIGPTHDDITTDAAAEAFNLKIKRNSEAERLIRERFEDSNPEVDEPKLKMADIPENAELIYNPVSGAPGYIIENVFIMAGVPKIMRAMFRKIRKKLKGGSKTFSKELILDFPESLLAKKMAEIQKSNKDLSIGSYPISKMVKGKHVFSKTSVVFRSTDKKLIEASYKAMMKFVKNL